MVTGTLISGAVGREQEVELYPTGRKLRVRGVQVYGKPAERATAGQRTAVNLADIEPGEIAARHGALRARPVPRRQIAGLHARSAALGQTAEAPRAGAFSRRDGGDRSGGALARRRHVLKPGGRAYARIVLREPALLLPGDRFIIRMFSPVVTIGGGVVLDTGGVRYAKADNAAERLDILVGSDVAAKIALLVR